MRRSALLLSILLASCSTDLPAPSTTTIPTSASSSTIATTTTTVAITTTTTEVTTTTTTDAGTVVEVVVSSGSSSLGGQRVKAKLGDEVTIRVSADRDDEVHLHGYDLFADVGAGTTVEINFTADIPGIFEVELEDAHLLLFELEVGP